METDVIYDRQFWRNLSEILKKAPTCPICGRTLNKVWQERNVTLVFNPNEGNYEEVEETEWVRYYCPYCECEITDMFDDRGLDHGS